MAKHAYVAYRLTVSKARYPDERLNMGDMGIGIDFLSLFHGFLIDAVAKPVKDEQYGRYLDVEGVVTSGRSIRFTAQSGRYGSTGRLIDVMSGEPTYDFNEDESPVVVTRNMLISPKSGDWAVFLAERYGGRGAATMILNQFKRAFRRRFDDERFVFKFESLLDPEAWERYLEEAEMTSIEVNRYGPSSDASDGSVGKSVGRIKCAVKPRWGEKRFARSLRDQVLSNDISVHQIIGLTPDDTDEIELVLNDGVQQRRLVVGQTEVPMLLYSVAEDKDDRPTDAVIFGAMDERIKGFRSGLGLSVGHDWSEGDWDERQLNVALAAVRDS